MLAYSRGMPSGPRRVDAGAGGAAAGRGSGAGGSFPVRPRREASPDPGPDAAEDPTVPPAAAEDAGRWRWRQQLREQPRVYRLYRVGVAVVGGLLLLAWLLVSWLPGPGGIPLLLAALAVLSTEFRWAHRLLLRARVGAQHLAERVALLPLWSRMLGSAALVLFVLGAAALGLAAALGVPAWVPEPLALQLVRLPGVDPRG